VQISHGSLVGFFVPNSCNFFDQKKHLEKNSCKFEMVPCFWVCYIFGFRRLLRLRRKTKQNKTKRRRENTLPCQAATITTCAALLASSLVSNDLAMAVRDLDAHVPGCLLL
jgi:hypothetical protein